MVVVPRDRIDGFLRSGAWIERRLDEDLDATVERFGDREAVVDPPNRGSLLGGAPQRWTYVELDRRTNGFARELIERGLRKDDVLLVQLPNCAEQIAVYLACMRHGIVISPVPMQYREHELTHILRITQARAVLSTPEHAPMFAGLGLRRVLSPDAVVGTSTRPAVAERPTAHDVVTICWTSGTEGAPKGVPRNHNEWRTIGRAVSASVGLPDHARLLNPFPLTSMGGIGGLLVPWLLRAGTFIQHHPFVLPVFLQQLCEEALDYTVAPPALLTMLLQKEELLDGIDFQRLRSIGSGSAPLSEWMVREYFERFGVQIINYFGSNEGTSLLSTPDDVPDPAQRATCFPRLGVKGFAWKNPIAQLMETRLVDSATGTTIEEPHSPGELRLRGAAIFSGYYRQPELDAAAFDEEGFYRSGDLFELAGVDNELYRFVGRLKDIIIRGGVNISAEEIETLLLAHPAIAEAAVVGYPDATLGEKMCAVVVTKTDASITLEALCAFLRDEKRVAVFKLPERLQVLLALPRNPMGKVSKNQLREQLT